MSGRTWACAISAMLMVTAAMLAGCGGSEQAVPTPTPSSPTPKHVEEPMTPSSEAPAPPSSPTVTTPTPIATPTDIGLVKAKVLENPEEENPYGDKVLETSAQYQIVYVAKDDLFQIVLHSTPLSEAREAAEEALLKRIEEAGGNLDALCQFKVQVGVPRWVRCPEEDKCLPNVQKPDSLGICSR